MNDRIRELDVFLRVTEESSFSAAARSLDCDPSTVSKVIHSGRQLATAEARLLGPDGTLYAHATTTCLVFETVKR